MSTAVMASAMDAALTGLETALDAVAAASLDTDTDTEVLDAWVRLERVRRRLDPVEYVVIGEVEARGIPFAQSCRNTTALAKQLLRISGGEAAGRVRAAHATGPRRTLSGEPLEPIYPTVAAAQAVGDISARHAKIVVHTIEKLPAEIRAIVDRTVETILVDYARDYAPDVLAGLARDLGYSIDQDGQYNEARRRDRDRSLTLRHRVDGSSASLDAELTAECAEHLHTLLDILARPKTTTDSDATDGDATADIATADSCTASVTGAALARQQDPRTAAQRRHDALLDILKLVERAELIPTAAGISATIILTMDANTYATAGTTDSSAARPPVTDPDQLARTAAALAAGDIAPGSARTGHGYTIPADLAKRWAGMEARVIAVLLSKTKEILAYSEFHRIFKEAQRLALIARDGGCSLPGCDVGPQWCEAHHVTPWRDSKRTSVDDGTLLCAFHHRFFEEMGWVCVMRNGRPHWTLPATLHPALVPH